jgi:hypothetical protein
VATLSVITPSYRPDLDLCRDLAVSVGRFGPSDMEHCVIVPPRDYAAFAGIGAVRTVDEFLPRSFVRIPGNMWINLRRPFFPARGWIVQQLIKLEASARSTADVVLLVDSDMVFMRPFSAETFYDGRDVRFFRAANAVHAGMPRHKIWHQTARRLLGLPVAERLPLHDYICWPMAWSPGVVRSMLRHIEENTGMSWQTAVAGEMHFSEGILYGVYVDEVLGGSRYCQNTMLSVHYSDECAIDQATAARIISSGSPADIAVMISAKSTTSPAVRKQVLQALMA